MLKKAFLTSIFIVGALLLPHATHSHDASLVARFTSKELLMSATEGLACLLRNEHNFPAPQLQTHKPQQLLYSKLQSTVFKTFEANLIKQPSLDFEKREVLNALRQGIFLNTRYKRAPPTKNHSIL